MVSLFSFWTRHVGAVAGFDTAIIISHPMRKSKVSLYTLGGERRGLLMSGFLSIFLEPVTTHIYWREHVFLYHKCQARLLSVGVVLVLLGVHVCQC